MTEQDKQSQKVTTHLGVGFSLLSSDQKALWRGLLATAQHIVITCHRGPDGDAMFFADKSEARAKLRELQKDDRYSWNCEADVCLFTGWGRS